MKKILAAVHDPGAAMMLLPVLKALEGKAELSSLASSFSASRFRREGVPAGALPTQLIASDVENLLDKFSPGLLVTGTSWGSNAEQALRDAAVKRKIPSLTVIDYWANYLLRFGGRPSAGSIVCVLDGGMANELVLAGFSRADIRVTGHPYLELLANTAIEHRGITENAVRAIFLSEPNQGWEGPIEAHPFLQIARDLGTAARWTVKLHPKETQGPAHQKLMDMAKSEGIIAEIRDDSLELPMGFREFEFVAGFQSMGLFEAAAMGLAVSAFPHVNALPSLRAAMSAYGISTTGAREARKLAGQMRPESPHSGSAARLAAIILSP